MTKNKYGNNKNGLGIMDLINLSKNYPMRYQFAMWAINIGFYSLAKRLLDIN